jgi:hypothetical protein
MGWIKAKNHLSTVPLKLLNTGCTKVLLFFKPNILAGIIKLFTKKIQKYKNRKKKKCGSGG